MTPTQPAVSDTGTDPAPHSAEWRYTPYGERVLTTVNDLTFDALGARLTLAQAFRDQLQRPDTLYIIAGSDSGHLITYVRDLPAVAGTRYLFVDPPPIHDILKAEGLFSDLPPHIRCASTDDWPEVANTMRLSDYLYVDAVEVVFSLAAQAAENSAYTELAWSLRETVSTLRWQTISKRGSEAFIACQLANAADNRVPASVWRQALPGRTGVLLAGGPSLDEALEWVSRHRQSLVVIAVSRISRRLLDVGLQPDFVVSVDPTEMSYEISRDMLRFQDTVAFINQYHVNPRLLGQWPHRSYYLGNVLPWKTSLNPVEPLQGVGPTVTNTALDFASALGLTRVILAGVDLCFTPEGHTHAQGSNERKAGPRFDLTGLQVETNAGDLADTTADFASAVQMLSLQARRLRLAGMEIINPAPRAAKIEGVLHCHWDDIEVSDPPLARPISPPNHSQHDANTKTYIEALIREMRRKLSELETLNKRLAHGKKITTKLFDADGTIKNRNHRKRLERLEHEIDEQHPDLVSLIRQCGTSAFLRALQATKTTDELNAAEVQTALLDYYNTFTTGAEKLEALINRGIQRARLRLQELDPSTDFSALADRWLEIKEPGRIVRWQRHLRGNAIIKTSQSESKRRTLLEAWASELENEHGQHLTRARAHADLRAVRPRLEHLFAEQRTDDIARVIEGLKITHDQNAAAPYLALARGMQAEIQQNIAEALAQYEEVLKYEQQTLWLDALRRIAYITLRQGHAEAALQALECMAQLHPQYLVQYADALAATGNITEAINAYERYFNKYPHDIHGKIRLTRILVNANAIDAAKAMITHLKQDPSNRNSELINEIDKLFSKRD